MNRGNVLTGFWLGLLFSVHLLLQVIGLAYAEMQPGQAAFLVAPVSYTHLTLPTSDLV